MFVPFSTMNPYSLIAQELGNPPSYIATPSNDIGTDIKISISKQTIENELYVRIGVIQVSTNVHVANEKEIAIIGIV